ncbi:hypothetical protein [Pelomonas sp. BJYL3]|uniref:hypothetical protein n=1 Tax=Pelomonas sp. BJYL3 TaxID=2976697 RepID=UPI0022B34B12|nr:hypothetical protein [Pelomonas sp. BJYL3]
MIPLSIQPVQLDNSEKSAPRVLLYRAEFGASRNVHFVVEPFTWAWVGINICEGIIAGIAGKLIVGALFDDPLESTLKRYLEAFAAIVRAAIAENELRRLAALAESTQRMWIQYQNSPDPLMLTLLQVSSSDLTSEAKSLGLRGVPAYGICGSIHLAVLQQRYLASNAEGDKKNLKAAAKEFSSYCPSFAQMVAAWNASRWEPPYMVYEVVAFRDREGDDHDRPERPIRGRKLYWACRLDGQELRLCDPDNSKEVAEGIRQQYLERERARQDAEILGPLWALDAKWKEIASQ